MFNTFIIIIILLIIIIIITSSINCKKTNYFTNYHFLHISKNAGTSIRSIHKQLPFSMSNHDITANNISDSIVCIAIIRDPVDRFVSSYRFAKNGGFSVKPGFSNHPINKYDDINDFVDDIKNGTYDALHTGENGESLTDASVIYWPQVHWLRSIKNKKLMLIDFNYVNEAFKQLFNVNLPVHNNTKKQDDLNEENRLFISELYGPDNVLYKKVRLNKILNTDSNYIKQLGSSNSIVLPNNYLTL
jgi:hypothetical protein